MSFPLRRTRPALKLRPYQMEAVAAARECWDDPERGQPLVVMATGTGKTATAMRVVADELEAGNRVVWLAHRQELLDQPLETLHRFFPHLADRGGIVQAGRNAPDADVVFASVQTLLVKRRLNQVLAHGRPDLVIVDEAHHSVSPSHSAVMEALGAPRYLGLTATPDREDGADLGEHWEIAYSYGIVEGIRDGVLVPAYAVDALLPDLDLSRVSGRRDYDDAELARELERAHVVEHTVAALGTTYMATNIPGRDRQAYLSAEGRGVLVFTVTIEQARLTAEALEREGWRARYVSGETPKTDRKRLLKAFQAGRIDVLCNAGVLTEGTDLPRASCLVLARATKSWPLFVQMVGRGLRPCDGKDECLVIDLVGATTLHDLRSAPVLIGGTRCPDAQDGVHTFERLDNGKGRCSACGKTIGCFAALEHDATAHDWHDADGVRRCVFCGTLQCPGSENGRHDWQPVEDQLECLGCGAEMPMRSEFRRPNREREPVDAAWQPLHGLTPETWVVDVDPHGLLFVTDAGARERFRLHWLKKGGRKPRQLTREPVPKTDVRAVADDIVRRAERVASRASGWRNGRATDAQIAYARQLGLNPPRGVKAGELADAMTRVKARQRAINTGIAAETEET